MMHFFIKPKIHLDVFTNLRHVIENAPVTNGIEAIPAWWKNLPKSSGSAFFPTPTMKTCVGMHEYYSKSICMPLWSDLCISVSEDGLYKWQFSNFQSLAERHSPQQYEGFLPADKYGHLKIHSPWLFSTKSDISWVATSPIYNRTTFDDYTFAQGLLNFNRQHSTNIQLFLNVSCPRTYIIPFGSVFLFTPMSDKKVVLHRHLISDQEYKSKSSLGAATKFINRYKHHQTTPKCPYKDHIGS
jgi:hypothetical protein